MATQVQKLVEPYVDLGNLLLIDRDPLDVVALKDDNDGLAKLAQQNVQFLYNKIWELPRKVVEDATCAQLPEQQYPLPREKPIPKPRAPTRWEKFAQSKGIVKKNDRSRKVFDENTQEWKPRYGYRANDETKDWLIEIPESGDPNKDYFGERAEAKRERVQKNEFQRLRNVAQGMNNRQTAEIGRGTFPQNDANFDGNNSRRPPARNASAGRGGKFVRRSGTGANSQPLGVGDMEEKSRDELTHLAHRTKHSTASVGRFQPALKGDQVPKGLGNKRKFESNLGNMTAEREHQLKLLDNLKSKKPRLNESRFNATDAHIRREANKSQNNNDSGDDGSDAGGGEGKQKGRRKSAANAGGRRSKSGDLHGRQRAKSDVHRQQSFQKRVKQHRSGKNDGSAAGGGGRGGRGGGRPKFGGGGNRKVGGGGQGQRGGRGGGRGGGRDGRR